MSRPTFVLCGRRPPCLAGNGSARPLLPWWAVCFLITIGLAALACSPSSRGTLDTSESRVPPGNEGKDVGVRFLLGGWVLPKNEEADPFANILRAFIITTEEELRDLLNGVDLLRIRGSLDSLHKADLDEVIVVAAYHLWRPLKGDPLSITGVSLDGTDVEVNFELLEDPQGHEFPYLVAPLQIGAIERKNLPRGVPLRFVFRVNGEDAAIRTITLK